MRKSFLVLAVLLMMGSAAFAGGGFDFCIGPKVGYQTATLSYKKADIKAGFANHYTVGLYSRLTFGHFYVQPEVLYFKTSSMFDVDFNGTGNDNMFNIPTGAAVNLTLNSMNLQVPVLFGVEVLDLGLLTLRAQAGPTANFVLQSTPLWDYTTSDGSETHEFDAENLIDTKSIAWGMQAGLGTDILGKITIDINYNFGLSRLFNALDNSGVGSDLFDFSNMDESKQNLFMVTVGLKLF